MYVNESHTLQHLYENDMRHERERHDTETEKGESEHKRKK